jgi:signal recognition particle subunit SRP54
LGSGRKVSDVNNLVDRFTAAQKMMKQVRIGAMPAGMPPGMGMPALPKVSTPVAKKKKSKSGNPAKRAQEEAQ